MTNFLDPYHAHPEEKKVRLQTWILADDHEFIKSIRPSKGTIMTVNNILWQRCVEALKASGIDSLHHKLDFEQFIMGLVITGPKQMKKPTKNEPQVTRLYQPA
jgi:hypothetical protein